MYIALKICLLLLLTILIKSINQEQQHINNQSIDPNQPQNTNGIMSKQTIQNMMIKILNENQYSGNIYQYNGNKNMQLIKYQPKHQQKQLKSQKLQRQLQFSKIYPRSIRYLQNQKPPTDQDNAGQNKQQKQSNSQLYLTLLIVVLGVLTLIGVTCCIGMCIRQMIITGRFNLNPSNARKVANVACDNDMLYPPLKYQIFLKEIGKTGNQACVICLMEFQEQKKKEKQEHIKMKNEQEQLELEGTKNILSHQKNRKRTIMQRNFFIDNIFLEESGRGSEVRNGEVIGSPRKNNNSRDPHVQISQGNQQQWQHQNHRQISIRQIPPPIRQPFSQNQPYYNNNTLKLVNLKHTSSLSIQNNSLIPQFSSHRSFPHQEQSLIKMTVCGHLLHAKCLDDWLNRQNNCPLCRQPFTLNSISKWQQLLGFNFQEFYQKYCQYNTSSKMNKKKSNIRIRKQKKTKNKSSKNINSSQQFQPTVSQLQRSNPVNSYQFNDDRQNSKQGILINPTPTIPLNPKIINQIQQFQQQPSPHPLKTKDQDLESSTYTQKQQYAIIIYRKIVKYHSKRLLLLSQQQQQFQQQQQQQQKQQNKKIDQDQIQNKIKPNKQYKQNSNINININGINSKDLKLTNKNRNNKNILDNNKIEIQQQYSIRTPQQPSQQIYHIKDNAIIGRGNKLQKINKVEQNNHKVNNSNISYPTIKKQQQVSVIDHLHKSIKYRISINNSPS